MENLEKEKTILSHVSTSNQIGSPFDYNPQIIKEIIIKLDGLNVSQAVYILNQVKAQVENNSIVISDNFE